MDFCGHRETDTEKRWPPSFNGTTKMTFLSVVRILCSSSFSHRLACQSVKPQDDDDLQSCNLKEKGYHIVCSGYHFSTPRDTYIAYVSRGFSRSMVLDQIKLFQWPFLAIVKSTALASASWFLKQHEVPQIRMHDLLAGDDWKGN